MNHSWNCGKNVWKKSWIKKQNNIFFGINLSYKLYAMTNNLSKSLQSTKMPAIKGKKCADLVIDRLRTIRNDEDFDSFFEVVKEATDPVKEVGNQPYQGSKKSQISLSCNTLLAMKDLRTMLITRKQPTNISNQCIFKLLAQSSVSIMIDLNSLY